MHLSPKKTLVISVLEIKNISVKQIKSEFYSGLTTCNCVNSPREVSSVHLGAGQAHTFDLSTLICLEEETG